MNHISTLRMHQLRLGELGPAERAPLDEHLDNCALCAARLAHQDATRAAFVRTPVPAAILPRPTVWERLGALRGALLLVPVALAAALVFSLPGTQAPEEGAPGTTTEAPSERLKGQSSKLEAWVQAGASARPLYTDEPVRPGTRVQLKYDAGAHRFVTLAGRDAHGTVEVYGTVPAAGPGLAAAPFALTLDDTSGAQEFFAFLTDTRPAPDAVMSALGADPIRMERSEIASVTLRKE